MKNKLIFLKDTLLVVVCLYLLYSQNELRIAQDKIELLHESVEHYKEKLKEYNAF